MQNEYPGAAPSILESFAVTWAEVRAAFVEALGDPFEPSGSSREIPPATQLILERARLRAMELQDQDVSSEHVLLVLTEKWDNLAVSAFLRKRGLHAETVRERVVKFTENSSRGDGRRGWSADSFAPR
jgi:ATP-dependent Clp protease ATP-binding subunit ClpA